MRLSFIEPGSGCAGSSLDRGVDAAFECPIKCQHLRISKGQDMGHDHAGYPLYWIEPVISIAEPGPAQSASAAAVRPGFQINHIVKPPTPTARRGIDRHRSSAPDRPTRPFRANCRHPANLAKHRVQTSQSSSLSDG